MLSIIYAFLIGRLYAILTFNLRDGSVLLYVALLSSTELSVHISTCYKTKESETFYFSQMGFSCISSQR